MSRRSADARTLVGVDFDNTIVSYDRVFHSIALERGLVSETLPVSKEAVRDYLRAAEREEEWTQLQGYVYGPGMELAEPFEGALEFFERCRSASMEAVIISHRTRRPYLGYPYDLHASAQVWLDANRIPATAYFEVTMQAKLERIVDVGCTHFVDDLPEFLTEPGFPDDVTRWLFDPDGTRDSGGTLPSSIRRVHSWRELSSLLVGG